MEAPPPRPKESPFAATDEYTGQLLLLSLVLLAPLRLVVPRAAYLRAAQRFARLLERLLMLAFLALLLALGFHLATGFDPLPWLGLG